MVEWLQNPHRRMHFAWALLIGSLLGWPATHVLILVTQPAGATSWVFHVLLAISWWSITLTALDILSTTDVRREQDDQS